MSAAIDTAEAGPLVARREWRRSLVITIALTLAALAWWLSPWSDRHDPFWRWAAPAFGAWCLAGIGLAFLDRAPRLIIAADGLSWRERRKDPLFFLAWSRIVSAELRDGHNEDIRFLRLTLAPPPALQQVTSDRPGPHRVDIKINGLDLSEHALTTAIRRRAPHLSRGLD